MASQHEQPLLQNPDEENQDLEIPQSITTCERFTAVLKEFLPSPQQFSYVFKVMAIYETVMVAYMSLCAVFQTYQPKNSSCVANPPKFTDVFLAVIMPFYLIKVLGLCCQRSRAMMYVQIVSFFLSQLAIGVWEVLCIIRLTELQECQFSVSYLNMFLYFSYSVHSVFNLVMIPLMCLALYCIMRSDTARINNKIVQIKSLPTHEYDPATMKAQQFCAICMDEFRVAGEVAWLSCDTRHFFHGECVKYWLFKAAKCPLCKAEVDFDRIKPVYDP